MIINLVAARSHRINIILLNCVTNERHFFLLLKTSVCTSSFSPYQNQVATLPSIDNNLWDLIMILVRSNLFIWYRILWKKTNNFIKTSIFFIWFQFLSNFRCCYFTMKFIDFEARKTSIRVHFYYQKVLWDEFPFLLFWMWFFVWRNMKAHQTIQLH